MPVPCCEGEEHKGEGTSRAHLPNKEEEEEDHDDSTLQDGTPARLTGRRTSSVIPSGDGVIHDERVVASRLESKARHR